MSFWHKWRFHWFLRHLPAELQHYYAGLLPLLDMPLAEAPLMAIDMEMTGLDASHDQIISVGLVPFTQRRLALAGACHQLVKIQGSVGQSATIHGIVDQHLQRQQLDQVHLLSWILQQSFGKVLVLHHAPLDIAFLAQLIQRCYYRDAPRQLNLYWPVIDTLQIERQRLLRERHVLPQGSLRLAACRERYHLPVYGAHNALMDAIACGELFLAQTATLGAAVPIADFLSWQTPKMARTKAKT